MDGVNLIRVRLCRIQAIVRVRLNGGRSYVLPVLFYGRVYDRVSWRVWGRLAPNEGTQR